jgi:protein-S-isoprenylcysteine O-methyltransferase Ste14
MRPVYIRNTYSLFLFLVQYSSLLILLLSGQIIPLQVFLMPPYILGLILGIWAIITMGSGNLNASPDVLPEGKLITSGPYKLLRHPMYSAILMVFIPLVIYNYSLFRVCILIMLIVNLFLKMTYEEQHLLKKYSTYSSYKLKTWRIIPYVF